MKEAHKQALTHFRVIIEDHIIGDNQVVKLSMLRDIYVSALENTDFANSNYRNEKLKEKIVDQFGERI